MSSDLDFIAKDIHTLCLYLCGQIIITGGNLKDSRKALDLAKTSEGKNTESKLGLGKNARSKVL